MKTETTEKSHSEQQAIAQLESIIEMVRALNKETAAEDYAKGLTLKQCATLLHEAEIDTTELDGDLSETDQLTRAREMVVEGMTGRHADIEPSDFEFDEDAARERIQEDALSVQVRSGWYSPGDTEGQKAAEFEILLCTGGPAVRLIGELSEHGEPDSVRLQHQDWGTTWTEYFLNSEQRDQVLTYCRCFYFGE